MRELILLIVGITIAYQLNLRQERRSIQKDQVQLLGNIYLENEINLDDFKESFSDRDTLDDTIFNFHQLLNKDSSRISNELLEHYLEIIFKTSTAAFHHKYLSAYLEDKARYKDKKLTIELIKLEALIANLEDGSTYILDYKMQHFYQGLKDIVDFYDIRVKQRSHLFSLSFKNTIYLLQELEEGQNYRMEETFAQMNKVKEMLEEINN